MWYKTRFYTRNAWGNGNPSVGKQGAQDGPDKVCGCSGLSK